MRKKIDNKFIIGLLIFTLFLTGAYALLAANLNIAGTAGGRGDFKIEFVTYNISDEDKATVTLNGTNTSLNVEANLSYPGDSVTIYFTIKNTGSLAATVSDLKINENSTDDINIRINGLANIKGQTLAAGESTNGSIVIT